MASSTKPKRKVVYTNRKQQEFLRSLAKTKFFVGGRGTGKGDTLGKHNYVKARRFLKAKSALAGVTFNALMNRTLPSIETAWNLLGWREYDPRTGLGHYVIGKRPPSRWPLPWQPSRNYEHVISTITGYAIEMMSQERAQANRGGSFDFLDGDELLNLKEEFFNRVGAVSVRANRYRYSDPLHWCISGFTSMPYTSAGQWIFKIEELMLEELKRVNDPNDSFTLADCQYLFVEAKTQENIEVLGPDYLERMKRELSDWEYQVEIMNFRIKKLPNGFYPALNEERHCAIDVYEYSTTETGRIYTKQDTFVKKGQKLLLSFDFNAAFTSMIVCQEVDCISHLEFRIGENLYVKPGDSELNLIDALVDKFVAAYKDHALKVVDIYGDRNGNSRNAQSTQTFYDQIISRLERAGWMCFKKVDGLDMDHDLRHILVNTLLREDDRFNPRIRFHHEKAKETVAAMQLTPILPGFKKDKADEKKKGVPQEMAPHLTDCFDNVVCRLYGWVLTGDVGHEIWIG